jgi:hypothetical protein
LTIENLVFTETSAGPTTASLTVRLSRAPASSVTVDFRTLEGSAKANDFVAASGSLTFDPGGAIQQSINVLIVGDLLPEPDENLAVDLSNARGATIGRARGVVVIVDDDETLSYHNSLESRDVNGDRKISALDALIVINEINAKGSYRLPSPPTPKQPWSYYDVNDDGKVSALDALIVINYINNLIAAPQDEPPFRPDSVDATGRALAAEALDAPASTMTATTARATATDAVFTLSAEVKDAPFACNNRGAVYRETYRRHGSPRFSS